MRYLPLHITAVAFLSIFVISTVFCVRSFFVRDRLWIAPPAGSSSHLRTHYNYHVVISGSGCLISRQTDVGPVEWADYSFQWRWRTSENTRYPTPGRDALPVLKSLGIYRISKFQIIPLEEIHAGGVASRTYAKHGITFPLLIPILWFFRRICG